MSHKAPPSTVFEAIDRSIRQPEIGAGWDATVYPLSGLEREYVLRVRHDDVPKLHTLTTSTTLTPINCGYNSRMVAPPLMLSKALSIHSRQPGKSLNIYWTDLTLQYQVQEQLSLNEARQKAYTKVLARQENLPLDTYRTFLQDMNFLTARRRGIDPVGDNIMLSKTTLRWVDIGNQPENNHLQNVEDMMFKFTGAFKPSPTPEVLSLKRHITSKLNMAAKQTNTPRTQHETLALIPQSHPFASQKTITEIARLPLSATPIELQHSLREVEQHIERVY